MLRLTAPAPVLWVKRIEVMTHFFNYKSEEIKIESEYSYLIDQMVDVMFLMMLRVEEEDML